MSLLLFLMLIVLKEAACTEYECGLKNIESELDGKILGGHETDKNEYPWQVSLQYVSSNQNPSKKKMMYLSTVRQFKKLPPKHYCGGSLIDPSWVLTAAHCVDRLTTNNILVKAGKHNLDEFENEEGEAFVEQIIQHEEWKWHSGEHDIALLKLKTPFQLSKAIGTICLPVKNQNTTGMVTVTGWGATRLGGATTNKLMEVEVPAMSDEACRKDYSSKDIRNSMICAGYPDGGLDSCQGDSGGPMVATKGSDQNSAYYLAGIVSWGDGCGLPNKPGVYTEVSYYYDWINKHMMT
ncbi:Serine protease 27 [Chamberlinius hualienensis]